MKNQRKQAHLLKELHIKGKPLILYNIWDAGSAKTIEEAGAKVVATSSWAVAAAHGYEDGEKVSFDLALKNLERIVACIDLPVTFDIEGGYGHSASEVQETVAKVIQAGAVGVNFEDQVIGGKEGLYSIKDQCTRIKAVSKTAEQMSVPLFINARTDIFLKIDPINHTNSMVEEALLRASAYAESGASGFFVPGLENADYIQRICKLSPIPVNVLIMPNAPQPQQLAQLGVSRISYGHWPYCSMIDTLKEAARTVLALEEQ